MLKTRLAHSNFPREKILVYGITGMVGSRISQLLRKDFNIYGPPHSHLDLANTKKVLEHLIDTQPDQIIYAAGLTKVDEAQTKPKLAYLLNSEIPATIAKRANRLRVPFHYISTDAVFDGTQGERPYREGDKTNPISIYGKSKLKGELAILSSSPKNLVIRTIMVYSSNYPAKSDFARLAYESLKNKTEFQGIADQIVNPTFVDDLVIAISALLKKRSAGIYHFAAKDYVSNLEFVEKIAFTFGFPKKFISSTTFEEFFKDKKAPRTRFCWLDTKKFQSQFKENFIKNIDRSLIEFKYQIKALGTQPINI